MTEEHIALHKRLLFALPSTTPTLKVYAIASSVRDDSLKEKVPFSLLDYVDLWHEDLWELEQERPLYLIELEKDNDLTDYLLSQHKESIATYFISPYSLEALRAYYRMFTHVKLEIEEGVLEDAMFVFNDPNTLPRYIKSLYTQKKVDEFFVGTAMWLMPDIEKEEELYLAFRDKRGEVEDVHIDLAPLEHEPFPSLDFETVSLPHTPELETYTHEVNIDFEQFEILRKYKTEKFAQILLAKMIKDGYIPQEEEHHKEKVMMLIAEAQALDLGMDAQKENEENNDEIYKYVLCAWLTVVSMQETKLYQELLTLSDASAKVELLNQVIWKLTQEQKRENHE